jgi:tellurite resistance protein
MNDGPVSIRGFSDARLEAMMELMFLAAYADGDMDDEERFYFESRVSQISAGRMRGAKFEEALGRIQASLATAGRQTRLLALRNQLPDLGSRRQALAAALEIMAADGVLRTSERELLLEVAEALEVDRGEAADMVKELGFG